ncbi:MAG: hypothetical protein AAB815_00235 [Patescibacteria group bacterium]
MPRGWKDVVVDESAEIQALDGIGQEDLGPEVKPIRRDDGPAWFGADWAWLALEGEIN